VLLPLPWSQARLEELLKLLRAASVALLHAGSVDPLLEQAV
jgi:hypothetical protein